MALQDDIDQKVTDDVQSHMGRLTYNNIILAAQVEGLQGELSRAYDQINDLTAEVERSAASAGDPLEGEVVGSE